MRRGGVDDGAASVVAILMTDVEPAVRLNAALESAGLTTVTMSPMDDVRGDLRRARPDIVVLTGALLDAANVSLVRRLLWENVAVLGFTDVSDPQMVERLREIGYAETWPKPVRIEDVVDSVKRRLERQRLAELTGLVGESAEGDLELPNRMAKVNAMLDVASPAMREALLVAFLDRLQRPAR